MERSNRSLLLTILLGCGFAVGCTETDPVVREIGTTLVYFADPSLQGQGFVGIDSRAQAAEWDLQEALLTLDGQQLDLRFGEPCSFIDSAGSFSVPDGKCGRGIVVDSNLEPLPITLDLTFTMQVKRARPPASLIGGADFDGDGRPNDGDGSGIIGDAPCTGAGATDCEEGCRLTNCDDNCVLEPNEDQRDIDKNGIGDTCSLIDPFTFNVSLDSDLDGVPDSFDNCLWSPNPLQSDTSGNVPDGIGDICEEQVAVVRVGGDTVIEISRQADFAQPLLATSFLTVDFNDALIDPMTGELSCDWDAGTCDLIENEIEFCIQNSVTAAAFGCF